MSEEVGMEIATSEALNTGESLFGDKVDDPVTPAIEEQVTTEETEREKQGSEDADGGTAHGKEPATETVAPSGEEEKRASNELKVVVSIREGRATIGVQRPSVDPHIESFDDYDLPRLALEVSTVVERARTRWEEFPKHPEYARPAPSSRRRGRRRQGEGREATSEGEAEDTQQQAMRLF